MSYSDRAGPDRGSLVTRAFTRLTDALGSPVAFLLAFLVVASWVVGLFFVPGGFKNDNYQLLINTGTTIVTFLMVFIVQENTNRDARALQTKLDGQTAVLAAIAREMGLDDTCDLDALLGLEDGTSQEIKAEQERVRGAGR